MKRNEQLIENTWKIEDIYPNLDVFYKELEKAKTQSKELLKYKDHLTNASSLYAYLKGYEELNEKLIKIAKELNISLHPCRAHSSDVFYHESETYWKEVRDNYHCDCVEMESFALFHNAKVLGKKATCLLTISDSFITHEVTTSEERAKNFKQMVQIALELAE